MLSAGPDPMSLLRAFKRRWPLATGLGILAALLAMAAAWYLIPQKGEVVAYVQVTAQSRNHDPARRAKDGFVRVHDVPQYDHRNDEEQVAVDPAFAIRRFRNCR